MNALQSDAPDKERVKREEAGWFCVHSVPAFLDGSFLRSEGKNSWADRQRSQPKAAPRAMCAAVMLMPFLLSSLFSHSLSLPSGRMVLFLFAKNDEPYIFVVTSQKSVPPHRYTASVQRRSFPNFLCHLIHQEQSGVGLRAFAGIIFRQTTMTVAKQWRFGIGLRGRVRFSFVFVLSFFIVDYYPFDFYSIFSHWKFCFVMALRTVIG